MSKLTRLSQSLLALSLITLTHPRRFWRNNPI
jgi:hypothetical protein